MDWEELKQMGNNFYNEKVETMQGGGEIKNYPKTLMAVNMDKPIVILTSNKFGYSFENDPNGYNVNFGQGPKFNPEKNGLAWYIDKHTVFFFERPFNNTVVQLLKNLLPDREVSWDGNDVLIDGEKCGPSLQTGHQRQVGHETVYDDGRIEILNESEPLTGRVYCLRWDNLEDLNKHFIDSAHHLDRLVNKAGLTTLGRYLEPKGISKDIFEKMLMAGL